MVPITPTLGHHGSSITLQAHCTVGFPPQGPARVVHIRPCHKYIASRYFHGCKRPCTRTQGQTLLCQTVSTPKRECDQYSDLAAQYVFRGYYSLKFEILDLAEECQALRSADVADQSPRRPLDSSADCLQTTASKNLCACPGETETCNRHRAHGWRSRNCSACGIRMYALVGGRWPGGQVTASSQFRDALLSTPGNAYEPCDGDEAALYRTVGHFFEADCATCDDSRRA